MFARTQKIGRNLRVMPLESCDVTVDTSTRRIGRSPHQAGQTGAPTSTAIEQSFTTASFWPVGAYANVSSSVGRTKGGSRANAPARIPTGPLLAVHRKRQHYVAWRAAEDAIARAHVEHAVYNDGAGSVERSTLGGHAVYRDIGTLRVNVPDDAATGGGVRAQVTIQAA